MRTVIADTVVGREEITDLLDRQIERNAKSRPVAEPGGEACTNVSAELEGRYGIHVARVMVTAQGTLVHLRFRVMDAAKARSLLKPENLPVLVAEDNQTVIIGFPTWPEWDTLQSGSSYCLLYSNTRKIVRPGYPVTIIVGGLCLEMVAV